VMKISAVFPHSNGYCTEVIYSFYIVFCMICFYVIIFFLFIVVHITQWSVDFIVVCMPVSAIVSLGMIRLYAVIASNQIH